MAHLLTLDGNAKTVKGKKRGYITGILYLAPSNLSGRNVCPHASDGCRAACLYSAGRGEYQNVKNARLRKTDLFFSDKEGFTRKLAEDIKTFHRRVSKKGFKFIVRLNGTSDIPWENVKIDGKNLMELFPTVQFYDYTKNLTRMLAFLKGGMPPNYHLTFSRSESNGMQVDTVLKNGGNVAVVFAKATSQYKNHTVVNGDKDDLRFLDPSGVIVGLSAKGKAREDISGFVV